MSYLPINNKVSTENSLLDTMAIDEVFTGEWVDTLNFGTCVVGICASQNSATDGLVIQYSSDGINVCQDDKFTILANNGKVFSTGMSNRYMRIVYTNGGVESDVDLQTVLKGLPIKNSSHRITDSIVGEDDAELVKAVLTGLDPDGEFKNVEVEHSGGLATCIQDGQTGKRCEVEPLGSLKTITPVRLVGTTFSNGTKDPNFWVETGTTLSGSVTQAGQVVLATGTTADSIARYQTVAKARKITGTTNEFRAVGKLLTDPQANNIRRIGAYNTTDGYFFQMNGTTFQVGSRNTSLGADNLISSGSFNGNYGPSVEISTDILRLSIQYTALSAKFFINDVLLHTITRVDTPLTNSQNLQVTMENINLNGNTTNNTFSIAFATILRLGRLETSTRGKYVAGATTQVLKYNAGRLIRVTVLDNAGDMTIYDGTTAGGTVLAVIDASKGWGTLEFGFDFSDGLYIVSTSSTKMTVVYE